jgi:hypothetical protein
LIEHGLAVAIELQIVGGLERRQRLFDSWEITEQIVEAAVLREDNDDGLDVIAQRAIDVRVRRAVCRTARCALR